MNIFKTKNKENLNLDSLVEKGLITEEEKLYIKKERAIKEWEREILKKDLRKLKRR